MSIGLIGAARRTRMMDEETNAQIGLVMLIGLLLCECKFSVVIRSKWAKIERSASRKSWPSCRNLRVRNSSKSRRKPSFTTVASWSSNEQPKAHSFSRSPLSRCSINPAEQCALTLSYSSFFIIRSSSTASPGFNVFRMARSFSHFNRNSQR